MSEYENIPEVPPQNTTHQSDPYTYYAGQPVVPAEYRYVPAPKKKKKKLPWGMILIVALCCSLLGGAIGAGGGESHAQNQREDQGDDLLHDERSPSEKIFCTGAWQPPQAAYPLQR